MYTVIDNEGKPVNVEQDVYNELKSMRQDEFAMLTYQGHPHVIVISDNFKP